MEYYEPGMGMLEHEAVLEMTMLVFRLDSMSYQRLESSGEFFNLGRVLSDNEVALRRIALASNYQERYRLWAGVQNLWEAERRYTLGC